MGQVRLRVKPRSISITSGKGGTGKTTLTANLGVALGALGKETTILDGDLQMANLGLVMGMHSCELTFLDALTGQADLDDVIYRNYEINVVPMGFRFEDAYDVLSKVKREQVESAVQSLLKKSEFLLIDSPAGIQESTLISMAAAREMIPVCNPTYTSIVDAYKVIRLANFMGPWTRGIVVNRTGKNAGISTDEVEKFMSGSLGTMPVLADIPENRRVQEAEREFVPVVVYDPDCEASRAISDLAKLIVGERNLPYVPYEERAVAETTTMLVRALTGRRR